MNHSCYVELLSADGSDPTRLGGKGASLCRLVRLGHRVPPGFVVTADALRATIDALDLAPALEALSRSLAGAEARLPGAERIRQGLLSGRIPPCVLDPIFQVIDELRLWEGNGAGVIVRSSATVEDSAAHSFAGIFESIPITSPEALEPTIREVWASVFSPRALAYFKEIGLRETPAMAVVVQRFLAADRSGVMFTRFADADGRPRILVEHVPGGCEKLVKGEVTPDRLWLENIQPVPEVPEGPLAPAHARELARLAASLEEDFGAPQDVEWLVHEDAIHLVQSRPVTVTFSGKEEAIGVLAAVPILKGIGASPGTGSGRAHLAFNIEHALQLRRGQVLVTPMTNPDMVVAMRNSAAIVTDVGGIICHAAIVSRELGLPCVVGTEKASATLREGESVTVDGFRGTVYQGLLNGAAHAPTSAPARWSHIWSVWRDATKGRTDLVPLVSTVEAIQEMPVGITSVVLIPDLDLRTDPRGLWQDLEGMAPGDRETVIDAYLKRVEAASKGRSLARLYLLPLGDGLPHRDMAKAVRRLGGILVVMHADAADAPEPVLDPGIAWPTARAAVPLGGASVLQARPGTARTAIGGMEVARATALDTIRFFGHEPGVKVAVMPDPAGRARWWAVLPECGRFHQEFATASQQGEFEWLEVRPELVLSPLLKSLVQPGFEMVPRVLGFRDVPPLHIKWIKCRYHFRSDTFAQVWQDIVRATWDPVFMADLLRRVRASYDQLQEVIALFPETGAELASLSGDKMVALTTSWWPRWVEFFALCWFIQAQGDDILYPFIEETVNNNLTCIGAPTGDYCWPGSADFVAPTTPVMSADYMADMSRFRESLQTAGLGSREEAEACLARGEYPGLARQIAEHLRKWHWMRDRDLLFEPWDTAGRVIETAFKTAAHALVPYEANLRRNLLALAFHFDLAHATSRAAGLNHAARFLHDLNVERENHHVLWLKYSYPLRQLFVELERRLVAIGSLAQGDIFFLQAPELLDAAKNLPAPLPKHVISALQNRRRGYLLEARLAAAGDTPPVPEDDYY